MLRLRALDQREVLRRRKGASHARRKLGRIVGRLSEEYPLGLVQVDHTLADVIAVASTDRQPLQRPWLTLAIDIAQPKEWLTGACARAVARAPRCEAGHHEPPPPL